MINDRISREELLSIIDQLSFAVVDISLYLDSHPFDEDALDYFHEKSSLRQEAVALYTKKYGPLTIEAAHDRASRKWDWVNQPWPWEVKKGGCR